MSLAYLSNEIIEVFIKYITSMNEIQVKEFSVISFNHPQILPKYRETFHHAYKELAEKSFTGMEHVSLNLIMIQTPRHDTVFNF